MNKKILVIDDEVEIARILEVFLIKKGFEIIVYTESQKYKYVVEQTRIVEPTEVSVLSATSSPVITLISCYPYGIDSHRIVVIGSLESF